MSPARVTTEREPSKNVLPPASAASPKVQVTVKGESAFITTLREFVMLVALTDEESESLIAGDSVVIANGWTVERVNEERADAERDSLACGNRGRK